MVSDFSEILSLLPRKSRFSSQQYRSSFHCLYGRTNPMRVDECPTPKAPYLRLWWGSHFTFNAITILTVLRQSRRHSPSLLALSAHDLFQRIIILSLLLYWEWESNGCCTVHSYRIHNMSTEGAQFVHLVFQMIIFIVILIRLIIYPFYRFILIMNYYFWSSFFPIMTVLMIMIQSIPREKFRSINGRP
jgi:hypothetical protein